MYITRKSLKYIAVTVFTCSLMVNLFLKTVYGEALVSDATVEVVQDDGVVILENNVKQDQLPKTNEQTSILFAWLGILILIFLVKKAYYRLETFLR